MSRGWHIAWVCTALVAVVVYLCFVYVVIPRHEEATVCQGITIVVRDSAERPFTQTSTLLNRVKQAGLYPTGKAMSEISAQAIEDCVKEYPVVRKASCYKTIGGQVRVDVWQRVPVMRVATGKNYYVDEDREILPDMASIAVYVPIVTGHVSEAMAQGELFDFVKYIEDNSFWSAQIEQIHVVSPKRIELIPRVGSHVIILGDLNQYEKKLNKLQTFYTKAMSKTGWTPYKEIDLRFKGQVVCRK